LKKQGGGCSTHNGHCHLDQKQVQSSSASLEKDEYELVLQQLEENIPIASIRALLLRRTDTSLSYQQLSFLRKKDEKV
jgi:hypothetical protein